MRNRKSERQRIKKKVETSFVVCSIWMRERERENMSENEYKYTHITFVHKLDCVWWDIESIYYMTQFISTNSHAARSCKYLLPKWCRKNKFLWKMDGIEFNDDAKNKLENK